MKRAYPIAAPFALFCTLIMNGCISETPPEACSTDVQCQDESFPGYRGKDHPYCHVVARTCHPGCDSDSYCKQDSFIGKSLDPTIAAKESWCNPETHACEPPPVNATKGKPCSLTSHCEEGLFCVDQVCCTSKCEGTCKTCSADNNKGECTLAAKGTDPRAECKGNDTICDGSCDGSGKCDFPGSEKVCKPTECTDNATSDSHLSEYKCDGEGSCTSSETSCGGYTCDKNACKSSCYGPEDCSSHFSCQDNKCIGTLELGKSCGTNDNACISEHCVDGVCCNKKCDGKCEACNMDGNLGTCSAAVGVESTKDCPGDSDCGPGTCNAQKGCDYNNKNANCKTSSWTCSSGTETIYKCDATHLCKPSTNSCTPHKCDATQCLKGCKDSSNCVAGSVCDRTSAHDTGLGTCVNPSQVVIVSQAGTGTTPTTITDGLKALVGGKTHLRVEAGTYNEEVKISNMKATIIGVGTVKIANLDKDAVTIDNKSTVTLQGVTIASSKNGIKCSGSSGSHSKLEVIESTIQDNNVERGINTSDCDVTIRRSTIQKNDKGGAELSKGKVTIVNSLIVNNGDDSSVEGSEVGGLKLETLDSLTFTNNIVADNETKDQSGIAGGVVCIGTYDLYNSIFWKNTESQVSSCTPMYSDVQNGTITQANHNIDKDPNFDPKSPYKPQEPACFNAGLDTASGIGKIDIEGKARKSGTAVDMGAYEVKK